ncbi:hypothetical protein COS31_00205 [Candidatus Roizmanbacteria bacterium CG02_land_8_20_14_3_00_36_15]|uniref:HTH arsR-type domain-containing protein n=2 Tax=Candidatus Roizmaniibacteriota TaxID=1752723 RepID=A0A2M8KK00_9BACT|nr:MAG: hypothetical protein COS31_00205 [Candidatus Roizmanbacteria bacterium CG02_land_8_20_14_3_00_36_15]PIY70045.1 MAG: hypothetical protein COY89_03195 [Candidatus Roizmanbacteria bacterium CG_4_10_14_0_8_um_filter_36_36]PJA52724.1 MAG: hypothetical protein CO166_04515 [Candidatus Roizmanbacteria bacterium CG_4_9_14_3_um_filter_36_11]PJE60243.1 MAG: hypothetical protein COU86_05340 [Candidatus Roizmanbacteria bacterium CG10_big_fil_rev_8_21_14_0_10_36_26]
MLKIEYIWRELLYRSIEESRPDFTITELSKIFNLSTSVVSHALKPLKELGIVKINKKNSKILDAERLLFFWATRRNLKKELIYSTYNPLPVQEREASMPSKVIPTAYSAFRMYFGNPPADYENIYFYAKNLSEVEKRFPKSSKKNQDNLFILKPDPFLKKRYKRIPLAQIFVDLWNLPEWYDKEFSDAILLKIKEKIGL